MSEAPGGPRLYLVTPSRPGLGRFPDLLGRLLDAHEIACVRLGVSGVDAEAVARAADTLRPVCHERDVPLVIAEHFRLVRPLGLDGVHLGDGSRNLRTARAEVGADGIVGAHARASRHDGMTAAEIGADYVSFGPLSASSLGDGSLAPLELFTGWSEMIEVPGVAEGGLTPDLVSAVADTADFLALGDELWSAPEGPEAALASFIERLDG